MSLGQYSGVPVQKPSYYRTISCNIKGGTLYLYFCDTFNSLWFGDTTLAAESSVIIDLGNDMSAVWLTAIPWSIDYLFLATPFDNKFESNVM